MMLRDTLLKTAFGLACIAGYLACGIALAQAMGAAELSISWWALTIAWPVVMGVYFAIGFACFVFALGLVRALVNRSTGFRT